MQKKGNCSKDLELGGRERERPPLLAANVYLGYEAVLEDELASARVEWSLRNVDR